MYEKVQPVVVRQPNSRAAVELQKVAAKLAGIPVRDAPIQRKKSGFGFFRFLRSLFSGGKRGGALQEVELND